MPSVEHLIYIPGILLMGFAFGFRFGAKAAREEIRRQRAARKK